MASRFTPKHITSSLLLERVEPQILFDFLHQYADYFAGEGVLPESTGSIAYDRLSLLLASPNEVMPAALMADLFYWDEVSGMAQIEDLVEIAANHEIEFNEQVTLEEAVLLLRMHASEDLENLYDIYQAHGLLRKKKRFLSYFSRASVLPKWVKPSDEVLNQFSQVMDGWYDDQKKGRGMRVSVIEKDDSAWFIVRHGGTFKRENAVDNGEPKLVFYRPEAYDLLIYYHKHGELSIYNEGNSKKERQAYCRYLGECLFGNSDFFERHDAAKFTLEPLRKRGKAALDCSDVEGVHAARLTFLKFRFRGGNNHCVTHRAEDVFAGLENLDEQIPEDAVLSCMGVALQLDSALGGQRNLKLYEPNISVYDHERDAELAHAFLNRKGFIVNRTQHAMVH